MNRSNRYSLLKRIPWISVQKTSGTMNVGLHPYATRNTLWAVSTLWNLSAAIILPHWYGTTRLVLRIQRLRRKEQRAVVSHTMMLFEDLLSKRTLHGIWDQDMSEEFNVCNNNIFPCFCLPCTQMDYLVYNANWWDVVTGNGGYFMWLACDPLLRPRLLLCLIFKDA